MIRYEEFRHVTGRSRYAADLDADVAAAGDRSLRVDRPCRDKGRRPLAAPARETIRR